jgi:hypothetical protein
MLIINTDFESGNFLSEIVTETHIIGRIRKDANNKDCQWFMFAVDNTKRNNFEVILMDINETSFPSAWDTFQASIMYEGAQWDVADTRKENNSIIIKVKGSKKRVFISYFQPFTMANHLILTQKLSQHKALTKIHECQTSDGHKLEVFSFGTDVQKKNLWIIARQHPGETIVGPFMTGLVDFFESRQNTIEETLINYNIHIVHNMNPDGVVAGMHRTNTKGSDLNKDWLNPHSEFSSELIFIRNLMDTFSPSFFLDVHGDERTFFPYINVDGNTLTPEDRTFLEAVKNQFEGLEIRDFIVTDRDLSIGRHYVNHKYGCLCLILEMVCQAQFNTPTNKQDYFSDARHLAKSILEPIFLKFGRDRKSHRD